MISAVNPQVPATIQFSQGNTRNPDGTLVPAYSNPVEVMAQVQAFQYLDLRQIEGLNLTGTRRGLYLFGDIEGVVRTTAQGGDLVTFPGQVGGFPPNTVWLVAQALETWGFGLAGGWCKCAATLQLF